MYKTEETTHFLEDTRDPSQRADLHTLCFLRTAGAQHSGTQWNSSEQWQGILWRQEWHLCTVRESSRKDKTGCYEPLPSDNAPQTTGPQDHEVELCLATKRHQQHFAGLQLYHTADSSLTLSLHYMSSSGDPPLILKSPFSIYILNCPLICPHLVTQNLLSLFF